ncbi:MAG: bile acid:sodium symporter family protein [Marinicellaceae bacterium]
MGELYVKYEYWVAAFQLIFAMIGMGATLTLNDFKDVVREPRAVSIGLGVQLLLVPLIAFVFIYVFDVVAGVAIGIALIAAIPGGTTSNIFTYFAKGNVPLSISITGLTTFACLLTTPLILNVLISEYLPADFSMPTLQIIRDIVLTLLIPLIFGMFFLKLFKKYADSFSKWCIRLSLIGILLIVIGSISAGRLDLGAYGGQNISLVVLFVLLLLVASWLVSQLSNLSNADRTAIEMEVIVRNVNLAVLIKALLFPIKSEITQAIGDLVLVTVLLYGAIQLLFAAFFIGKKRLKS